MDAFPLVERPDGEALFLRPSGPVHAPAFLADAHRLASELPGSGPVLNLCRDRYAFMVAFAAALIRGRVCLLSGDPSPTMLAAVTQAHPGCVAAIDDPEVTAPAPLHLVRPEGRAGAAPNPAIPARQLAAVVFTSGSTGAPTAHRKAWGALVARSRAAAERFGLQGPAVGSVVGTVPPGHMYGFEVTALLPLHARCASWCGRTFFPADVQAALDAAPAPRILVTTPLQMRALLGVRPPSLQACISATAPLDPALAAEAETRWGGPVLEIFGATEVGSIASRRTVEGDSWRVYPGVALRRDDGVALVEAEFAPPVPLADEIEMLDADRFRLLGRRADMVKLGGRRASLAGLNRILTGLDGVCDGIFVVPDDLDQRSTARLLAVVVAPGRSAPSILADLRDRMDPIFLPRRVVHVDALPRNALGKLPRQAVLDLLAEVDAR
ncbi:MAG TPA: AMP-binding protein [Acetobacteraceae bacterium]|nr:AMP-binding protein [Acetobacteraceae bacterium]